VKLFVLSFSAFIWRLIRFSSGVIAGKEQTTSVDPTVVKKWPDDRIVQHNSMVKHQNLKDFQLKKFVFNAQLAIFEGYVMGLRRKWITF
jgi:hypothetical protein